MQRHGKNTMMSRAVCLLVGAVLVGWPSVRADAPPVPAVVFSKATQADQKAIAAQKVCKVSGQALGSMGGPIKASRDHRATFLCCASCEKKVLAEPDRYFTVVLTTVKVTKADQSAIATQKLCPVSGEDLSSMGGPIKVTEGTRAVFLCCKACLKKVQADPDKYLGKPTSAAATKVQETR